MTILDKLGKRLRLIRRNCDLSLFKVASGTGIHDRYLQQLESGKSKNPGLRHLIKLADFYGITIDELVGHQVKKETKAELWLSDKKRREK